MVLAKRTMFSRKPTDGREIEYPHYERAVAIEASILRNEAGEAIGSHGQKRLGRSGNWDVNDARLVRDWTQAGAQPFAANQSPVGPPPLGPHRLPRQA
jgi:hypothetical protein